MQVFAIVCFAIAAALGLTLAIAHLRGRTPGIPLALVHGVFAATGLVVLISIVLQSASSGKGTYALALFGAAALGGFVLFARHARKKSLPPALILGHGLLAVVGFALLVLSVL